MRSTRHRTSRASVNRSSTNSTGHNSAVSHAISCSSSVRVQGRNPSASRICLRVVLGDPAREGVLRELRSRHFHQLRDVLDRGLRDLLDKLREPALLLEVLQGQGQPADRIYLARDPLGVKPPYWSRCGGHLYVASELKALVPVGGQVSEIPPGHHGWGSPMQDPAVTAYVDLLTLGDGEEPITDVGEAARLVRKRGADARQKVVPRGMPVLVVDLLEVVEVEQEQRAFVIVACANVRFSASVTPRPRRSRSAGYPRTSPGPGRAPGRWSARLTGGSRHQGRRMRSSPR